MKGLETIMEYDEKGECNAIHFRTNSSVPGQHVIHISSYAGWRKECQAMGDEMGFESREFCLQHDISDLRYRVEQHPAERAVGIYCHGRDKIRDHYLIDQREFVERYQQ